VSSAVAQPKCRLVGRVLVALGVAAVAGAAVLVVLRLFFFVPFRVPAGAMLPTIAPGAHVWASPKAKVVRGAVVVFRYPEHPSQLFAKRIVGLEGDSIEVKAGQLYVNAWQAPRCWVGPWGYKDESDGAEHAGDLVLEHLDGASYLVFEERGAMLSDAQGPFTVHDGQYFVLGDNRNNSHDSRFWFGGVGGGVPLANTVGRVRLDEEPRLPRGAESLQAALDACMAKKPAQTSPPAPKR